MSDGKIYITISDERPQPTPTPTPEPKPETPKEKEKSEWDLFKDQFADFVKDQAKTALNYSIQNIGNFTGDYVYQKNIQASVSLGTKLVGIANATMAGGVAGFVFATASTIINSALSDISGNASNMKQNQEIERLRKISGLNSLYDGSRGTQS